MYTATKEERDRYKNVWVIAEMLDNKVQTVTHELLGAARQLADKRGSEVFCVVFGNGVAEEARGLFAYQADTVIVIDDPILEHFVDEIQAKALCRLFDKHKPEIMNHCDYPIGTSRLEGVNNKIKLIKRRGYGYSDSEYFGLKIKQAFPGKKTTN